MDDSQSIERAKSFFFTGLEKLNKNNFIGAEIDFESSLRFAPNRLSTLINLCIVLIKLNKFENAEKLIYQGLKYHPKNKDLLFSLVKIYNLLIQNNPDYAEAYINLANVYKDLKMQMEAYATYSHAIKLMPKLAEAYSNRANLLQDMKKYQEALIDCERAIAIRPHYAEAYLNKGNTLHSLNCLEDALDSYDRAIEINPYFADAYSNRGLLLDDLMYYKQAILDYDKAITLNPELADAYWNKSLNLLLTGDFTNGWNLYEWRWKVDKLELLIKLDTKIPYWSRQNTNSQSKILFWAEQGIGDEIFYFGMLKNFTAIKSKISVSADPRLHSLFKRSIPEIELINSKTVDAVNIENLFDYQAPIGDIGFLCEVDKALENKTAKNFLQINQSRCSEIKNKNPFLSGKFVCGISWKSNNKDIGITKSLNLIDLSPLLLIENVVFVSLQYGSTADEIEFVEKKNGIKIHTIGDLDIFNDIDGLVSLISLCDLVVTTSNINAHLTGAIGKKGMVLIPFSKGKIWYWHSGVGQSLWYPSLELVSQSQMNDWTDPINKCKEWVLGQL